ncbi:MAG: 5'/3'-nucleotidase SurE [Alistipes sp.]|jgi:5'-nucleotidase|nr:5'/3'-nucleotidase SurE [Alistipes sp.]
MDNRLIFLTNDDGVSAPGLARLIEVVREFGHVVVVAPESAQSGMSHAITMNHPLFLRKVRTEPGLEVYACSGTPVDCVKMALDHLLTNRTADGGGDRTPDLICSGINHGSNAAINILYSGTMGAAIEGGFYDVPSIGFSLTDHSLDADFEAAGVVARDIVAGILEARPATPLCLNVNIPVGRPEEIRGVRVCRQCRGHWREEFFCRRNPVGRDYYWLTGAFQNAEPEATDTDEWALAHGYVSVVPIQVDLTRYEQIASLGAVLNHES